MSLPWLPLSQLAAILDAHARYEPTPLVPALAAWTADDELPLWSALEEALQARIGAPFFAVPWPGAQALALAVARGLVEVRGRRVLDVGCGSGLASVACAKAGARAVACDTDPLACLTATLLAARHRAPVDAVLLDGLACPEVGARFDVVLAGDLVYSKAQGAQLAGAVALWRAAGATVVLADSGRPFFTSCGLPQVLEVEVEVPRGVDGEALRRVQVYVG